MTIFEIEKLFQDETTLNLVLEEVADTLATIDDLSKKAKSKQLDNPYVIDNALQTMQGCYGIIEPIYTLAVAEKHNREDRGYMEIKFDTQNSGGKFVSASVDREASAKVSEYRRVRNILEGYVKVCEKSISVLQSRLKRADDDSKKGREG